MRVRMKKRKRKKIEGYILCVDIITTRINGKIQIFNFVTHLLQALPVCLSLLAGWGNLSRWWFFTINFQGSGPARVAF